MGGCFVVEVDEIIEVFLECGYFGIWCCGVCSQVFGDCVQGGVVEFVFYWCGEFVFVWCDLCVLIVVDWGVYDLLLLCLGVYCGGECGCGLCL